MPSVRLRTQRGSGPGSLCRALSKSAMCRAATTVHTFGRMLASGLRYLIGCVPRRAARLSHGPSLAPWVPAAVPCLAALCPDRVAAAHAGPLLAEVAASDAGLSDRPVEEATAPR